MKRITASILALFFLVGVIGLNYDAHYCGGKLVSESVSFIPTDLSCGMTGMDNEDTDKDKFERHCCDNHHLSFQIDDDYNDHQAHTVQLLTNEVLPSLELKIQSFFLSSDKFEFIGYSPPPYYKDFIVLNQSFLI
ncbi:MAG: hypothetical protein ACFHU9_18230 [Fluviicola sp.]